jgi:hypothetical protein
MRLRGEFIRANGLVIPNNVTTAGAAALLGAALRIQDLVEPTLATNNYARLAVSRDNVGWPSDGVVNGEVYFESLPLVWSATAGPFDQPVTRMFICQTENGLVGDVLALSAALPDDLLIDVDTAEADRTFKYRLFAR